MLAVMIGGLFDLADGGLTKTQGLMVKGFAVVLAGICIATFIKNKAIVAVVGLFLAGSIVLWGLKNPDTVQNNVNQDIQQLQNGGTPTTVAPGADALGPR